MGKITGFNNGKFKSTKFLFSKIKRELQSLDAVGQIDEADFHLYVSEVLRKLGQGAFKEESCVTTLKDGKAILPKDFQYLYAAYMAKRDGIVANQRNHFQLGFTLFNDITCEVLGRNNGCVTECKPYDQVLEKVTVRQYVGEQCEECSWNVYGLLTLSPNVTDFCSDDSPNLTWRCGNEININDGYIYANFRDADIFLQYYAIAKDEDGLPMIPDIIEIEKACEWWIKYQLLLNYWFDGSVPDIQNKWGKAEEQYNHWMSEARFIGKLPSFSTLTNSIRRSRKLNKVTFFSQMDNNLNINGNKYF